MADWTKPFVAAYTWWRVPRSSYRARPDSGTDVGYYDVGLETEQITNITGGTITVNDNSETFESADVNCIGPLDIGTDLLRCKMTATWADGSTETVVLGTFSASVPSRDVHGSYEECSASLDGRLMQLATDWFDHVYTIPKGNNVGAYRSLEVRRVGITFGTMYPTVNTGVAAAQNIVWGFGTDGGSKLAWYNNLMEIMGARAAKTDPYGRILTLAPIDYDGTPVWSFVEGINATFLQDATDERDTTDVCNKVIVVYEGEGATIIGTATDDDPASAWSTVSMGFVKCAEPYSYELTDSTTQATANAKAAELLATNQSVVRRVTIKHVWCGVRVGDIVTLEYPSAGISGKFAVRTMEIDVGSAGCLCTTELRRFERA